MSDNSRENALEKAKAYASSRKGQMTGLQAVEKVAEAVGGAVYERYSGRGMFGGTCVGVSCDDASECIEEAALVGLRGACTDQLGKGMIVYWPRIQADTEVAVD